MVIVTIRHSYLKNDQGLLFQVITRESAHVAGVGEIYDRIHVELIGKMKEMRMASSNPFLSIEKDLKIYLHWRK